ncbi:MAG: DUF3641 domain-containing protein, partial [Nitrospirota bacterium]|nr:DUF3641 domain-containing protein [Nitrospirota bacterium]
MIPAKRGSMFQVNADDKKAMHIFDKKLSEINSYPLIAQDISTLQVNVGYKCNPVCTHCHVDASPDRTEEMSEVTVERIIDILDRHDRITTLDITGVSPEYNPHYRRLVKTAADLGKNVIVRTNLAIWCEPGMEDIPGFLAENRAGIVASLPCYTAEGVDGQRGRGTYDIAMSALKTLNRLGYGRQGTGLVLDLACRNR